MAVMYQNPNLLAKSGNSHKLYSQLLKNILFRYNKFTSWLPGIRHIIPFSEKGEKQNDVYGCLYSNANGCDVLKSKFLQKSRISRQKFHSTFEK